MHDMNKDMELAKYRFSLAEETYKSAKMCFDNTKVQKCVLIMDFTETVLIAPIMRCFTEFVLFLHWKVLISNVIKTLWHISIKSSLPLESFREKWADVWQDINKGIFGRV